MGLGGPVWRLGQGWLEVDVSASRASRSR